MSHPAVTIRPVDPAEADELTRIAHAAKGFWGYPEAYLALWRVDLTYSAATVRRRPIYAATRGSAILGFYALDLAAAEPELDCLWVDPPYIGQGIGRALVIDALARARQAGLGQLMVVADPNAAGFYRKLGAHQIGTTPSRPLGRRLPVLVWILR